MGQIERWAMKLNAPTALRSARNVTRDIVIADHEPFDVNALDTRSVRREREGKFSVEPCCLYLKLTQSCDPLACEIDHKSAGGRNIGSLIPTCLSNGQGRRVKVEPGIGLGV